MVFTCFHSSIFIHFFLFLSGIVNTIAGGGKPHEGKLDDCNDIENSKDGTGSEARFNYPWGVAYDPNNNAVYVADCVREFFNPVYIYLMWY